ncbi:VCBS domain-containing protein, partial [Colwellia sp. E2M01]|uniref:VCBS domain-containing protein n=1 Tax=Colwellia sp. E2M01 TaxID=2841561 RepID=UPI001C090276
NITLTAAGKVFLDAGNTLPEISLTTSGTSTDKTATGTPATNATDDETSLTLTPGSAEEDVTPVGATVATFSVSDEDETATVDFTAGTNTDGYYAIDGTNIILTAAGKVFLDAGNTLPEISLTTSGTSTDKTATGTPATNATDDETSLTLTAGSATEDVTAVGATVATFSVSDEDETAVVDFTAGTNIDGYYAIDGSNITLTAAGKVFLDAGNTLPEISLTTSGTSTDKTATGTPATNATDDETSLTLTAGSAEEDVTPVGATVATFSVSDEDETATVGFTAGTNTDGYYAIDGSNITLTAAGKVFLDAGNTLPEISLTTSGTSTDKTATGTPATNATDDAAVITVTASDVTVTEDDAANNTATGTVAITDVDTGEGTLASSTANYGTVVVDGSGQWTYSLDNTDAAVQALPAGETLTDTITFTSDDGTTETQT